MKTKSDNQFFTKSWTIGFLTNVLGVIVGILLTFGVTFLIQQHNKNKQIHELMILLKKEIIDNKALFEAAQEDFLQTRKAYAIILSDEWKTMPNDTLRKYIFYARKGSAYILLNSAWNVFQNSEVIQNLDNKELIVTVSSLYKYLEMGSSIWEDFLKEKREVFNIYETDRRDYIDALLKDKPSVEFMKKGSYYYTFEQVFTYIIDMADYTLYQIDNSGNYQYKFDDIYEDFDMFREKKAKESEVKIKK
jgi:hypothetical protein